MDLSVGTKLDILILIVVLQAIVLIIGKVVSLNLQYTRRKGDEIQTGVSALDASGNYQDMLDYVEMYLEKRPKDAQLMWSRARANFKLGNLEVAKAQFQEIQNSEPAWHADAEKYLSAIDCQIHS